jgi:hypothetical protein
LSHRTGITVLEDVIKYDEDGSVIKSSDPGTGGENELISDSDLRGNEFVSESVITDEVVQNDTIRLSETVNSPASDIVTDIAENTSEMSEDHGNSAVSNILVDDGLRTPDVVLQERIT